MNEKILEILLEKGEGVLALAIRVVLVIIFFLLGKIIIGLIRKAVRNGLNRTNMEKGVVQFLDSFLKAGLYVILIFFLAFYLGIEPTSVAALLASAGVAIGLALQGSLSNLAGGVLILFLKPFVVGDYIIEDTNKNEGTVKEIQIFYTKLVTIDNKVIVIPNGVLANTSLTNVTSQNKRRLDLKIPISYDSDLRKAKNILMELLIKEKEVLKEEEIHVFVSELGAHGMILGMRGWVKTTAYWDVRWRLLEQIKICFDEEGVVLPYEQLQVHFHSEK